MRDSGPGAYAVECLPRLVASVPDLLQLGPPIYVNHDGFRVCVWNRLLPHDHYMRASQVKGST
jgi:hypothetical protein